jgi:hypothetical protein
MKLVQFRDGQYGIRKWSWRKGWLFLNFASDYGITWDKAGEYKKSCRRDKEQAQERYLNMVDKGTPVPAEYPPLIKSYKPF